MDKLKALFEKEEIKLNDEGYKSFELYRNLILEWNEKINLTAITDEDGMNSKHFLDCLLLTKIGIFEENKKILDVGTGAGFPAVPLKIFNNNFNITMLDSLNKRIKFLNIVIEKLGLSNINAIHARAEEFGRKGNYRECYDIVTSRAVANLSLLLELTIPFVKKGGYFVAMKGRQYKDELLDSKIALQKLSCKLDRVETFEIEENGEIFQRNILIIKKLEKTSLKYPRNMGQIKNKPL